MPAVVDRVTVWPPVVRLLLLTSFNWTVIKVVEVLFPAMEFEAAVIVDVRSEGVGEIGFAIL